MSGPQANSTNGKIVALKVGEVIWIEAPPDKLKGVQQRISNVTHRPETMKHMQFKTRTYTAVGSVGQGDICYLIKVERTA